MPKITFIQPDGTQQTIDAENNWSVMQVAVDAAVPGIIGECGGAMACATCHCYIDAAWMDRVTAQDNEQSEEEKDMLDLVYDIRPTSRLGCQIKLNDALDGLVVHLPDRANF